MNSANRRGFLKVAGAGVAVAGAGAIAAGLAPAAIAGSPQPNSADTEADADTPPVAGGLVAFVPDGSTAEISIMVDGAEVTVRDRDLISRLTKASRQSGSASTDA